MLVGSIYGWDAGFDDLFDPMSSRNRDNCLEPFREMQGYASMKGVALHTADVVRRLELTPAFNLYIESIPLNKKAAGKNFLLLLESSLTVPINANWFYLNQFDEIFTWNLDLLHQESRHDLFPLLTHPTFTEIRVPNPIPQEFYFKNSPLGFNARPNFCCLIGSNRHANSFDIRELYSERVRAIRWFEKNAPHHFYLYGGGWRVPQKRLGRLGKFVYRLEKVIPFLTGRLVFPSYQGATPTKWAALSRTRFCICYENARDIPGYITEKIFDCLFAGCIPVYFGEANVAKWVPQDCFINFRDFSSYENLYTYLLNMAENDFISMQAAGRNFILSADFTPHSSQSFARKIIDGVLSHIK